MSQKVLDVIPKNVQVEHVAQQVHDAAVHKHGKDQRQVHRQRCPLQPGNPHLRA